MVDIISVCGLCICAVLICKATEKYSGEQAVLLAITVSAVILLTVFSAVPKITGSISELMDKTQLDSSYVSIIFKALGICYLTQFACDICRDCGENAVATAAEIAGKVELIIISLPLFESLINLTAVIIS